MDIIKQEKGITIIALVLVIILLMILAGVAIGIGDANVDSALDAKLQGELQMVQHAVLEQYVKYKTTLNENYIIGRDYEEQIQNFMNKNYGGEILTLKNADDRQEKYKKYYYLTRVDLEEIGIQESEYSYIVNYYTGEVMNADKFTTTSGIKLYVKGASSENQAKPSY